MNKKSIALPIVGIVITGVLTIIALLATLGNMMQISEAEDLPEYKIVNYNGRNYTQEKLVEQLKSERTGMVIFLLISAALLALCIWALMKRVKANRELMAQGGVPMQFAAQPMPPMGAPMAAPVQPAAAPAQTAACPHCGAPRKEGQVFCASCGQRM